MSSPDLEHSQEDVIKSLKEAVAEDQHATNGDVTTNGNGVHHDVSNGVEEQDAVDGVINSKQSKKQESDGEEEAPSTPVKEESPSTPVKEEAPSTPVKEEAPSTPVKEEAPSTPVKEEASSTPAPQEEKRHEDTHSAPVAEQHHDVLKQHPVAVCHAEVETVPEPTTPVKEERLAPPVHEDELPAVPVPKMREQWMANRQSSLEMKREVEAQSRPVVSKAAMSTSVDQESVRAAYEDVRSDTTDTEWAVFKFQQQKIVCSETGVGFDAFKAHFADDDRAFGFIRIQMGDEMSKRQKFMFLTWVGPQVSVIRRAKMSIDKAMVKNIVKNFAVELQVETQAEINVDNFREQLSRVGGANYGTGFRD